MHRLALALGGAVSLIAVAVAANAADNAVGGPRGVLAGLLVYGVVFGACGLLFRRPARPQRLTRPGDVSVTKPKPLASLPR